MIKKLKVILVIPLFVVALAFAFIIGYYKIPNPQYLKSMTEHTYYVGTCTIDNPVIVLFPMYYTHEIYAYVCSDSATKYISNPDWIYRSDVFLYIIDPYNIDALGSDHDERLDMAAINYDFDSLVNRQHDTCIYRNAFQTTQFDVYCRATKYIIQVAMDEVFAFPVCDSYRLGVSPHYTKWQMNKLHKQYKAWFEKHRDKIIERNQQVEGTYITIIDSMGAREIPYTSSQKDD